MAETKSPKLWIGVECTMNRVGDRFHDQCERNGHWERASDFARFREIGAERIRVPFLWERFAPDSPDRVRWAELDARTTSLREAGLMPIAGLVHHGSGPLYTNLLDPEFPQLLTRYARSVAERYPWIEDYTPVNEPLTTARFSALYGFWYPHARSDAAFVRALYHQVKATLLSMQSIREVQPAARLVQTEDFGRATSTDLLEYQADFENERRWLSFDLLCGRVDRYHPLYRYLLRAGLKPRELAELRDIACPPGVIGINHYPLSNRFLDHRLDLYPARFHGGNGRHAYADVGAVDTDRAPLVSPKDLLREVWERYELPIAVTEAHVRGHRETQVRWLQQIWRSARELAAEGVDVRAVTLWSLLGTYGWDSLCSGDSCSYEPGAYDLRAPTPRPTALAKLATALARDPEAKHPVGADPVRWPHRHPVAKPSGRPILITGARGTLGNAFARICEARGLAYHAVTRHDLDITDPAEVRRVLEVYRPWAVVNAAAYVKVDRAEVEQDRCFRENVTGAELLAEECRLRGLPLLTFSSDMVFDGARNSPYLESHPVGPLNVYGRSKAEGEQRVLGIHPGALVVRTSSFFGPWDSANFVTLLLRKIAEGREVAVASDLVMSPTYVPDLVHHALDFLIDGETGLLHLTNHGPATWASFAALALAKARNLSLVRGPDELLLRRTAADLRFPARRPRFSVLSTERVSLMPEWEDALDRYFSDLEAPLVAAAA